ncbi:MAG: hypothetical protein ACYC3S_04940 [Chloroflexota bacterium]
MLRRLLVIVSLLALVMAVVSPALADDNDNGNGKGKHTPTTTTATGVATAEKQVLNGKAFQATVVAVDGTNLIVKSDKFSANLTIATDGDTVIRWPKGIIKQTTGTTPKLTDFVAGDRVVIKLAEKPTDLTNLMARAIYLVPGQTFIHFTGDVSVAPAGGTMSVKNGSVEKEFAVDSSTPVRNGHLSTTLGNAQLEVGDKVTVVARANPATGNTLTAYSIALHGQHNGKAGDDADQQGVNENAANGQSQGKALGHDKDKPGRP